MKRFECYKWLSAAAGSRDAGMLREEDLRRDSQGCSRSAAPACAFPRLLGSGSHHPGEPTIPSRGSFTCRGPAKPAQRGSIARASRAVVDFLSSKPSLALVQGASYDARRARKSPLVLSCAFRTCWPIQSGRAVRTEAPQQAFARSAHEWGGGCSREAGSSVKSFARGKSTSCESWELGHGGGSGCCKGGKGRHSGAGREDS